ERDEDVFDGVVESQRLHRLALGPHDFGVARGRDLDVETRSAADGTEHHAAAAVDDAGTDGALTRHDLVQRLFHICHADLSFRLTRLNEQTAVPAGPGAVL